MADQGCSTGHPVTGGTPIGPPADQEVICSGGRCLVPERWSVVRHGTFCYRVTATPAGPEHRRIRLGANAVILTSGNRAWRLFRIPGNPDRMRLDHWGRHPTEADRQLMGKINRELAKLDG